MKEVVRSRSRLEGAKKTDSQNVHAPARVATPPSRERGHSGNFVGHPHHLPLSYGVGILIAVDRIFFRRDEASRCWTFFPQRGKQMLDVFSQIGRGCEQMLDVFSAERRGASTYGVVQYVRYTRHETLVQLCEAA